MSSLYDMAFDVETFIKHINVPLPEQPTRLLPSRKQYAIEHLREELQEFIDATTLEDELDAMIDMAYVALGRVIDMGIAPGAAFEAVQLANMERQAASTERSKFDAIKPPGWKPPDFTALLTATLDELKWLQEQRAEGAAPMYPAVPVKESVEVHPFLRTAWPKILVLGHARAGKDTACEILRDRHDFSFTSSSVFCAEHVVLPAFNAAIAAGAGYPQYNSVEDCYEDRSNHRAFWFDAISRFNTLDPTTLGRAIFERHDIYCGLRSASEFHALKAAGVFDYVVWIDASGRGVPAEPLTSCTVEPWMADYVIENNDGLEALQARLDDLMTLLMDQV